MFMMTAAAGMAFAFPDVCLTPAGPALVPVPYPNVSMGTFSDPDTAVGTVLVCGMPALTLASVLVFSQGDEAGTGGGVISHEIMGQAVFFTGSTNVMVKGMPAARLTSVTGQNGELPNAEGAVMAPAQTVVLTPG